MSPHQEDGRYILPNSSLVVSMIMLMKKSQSVENAFDNDERHAMPLMLMMTRKKLYEFQNQLHVVKVNSKAVMQMRMSKYDIQCLEITPRTRLHVESMERRTLSAEFVEPAELWEDLLCASRLLSTFPAPPRPMW